MNKWIAMGRLTKEPDVRRTPDGEKVVARFTLAVDRIIGKNYGEVRQTADFAPCECWGKRAEAMERYCHKGTKILVEGTYRTGSYVNKDGETVYTQVMHITHWEFVESKNAQSEAAQQAPKVDDSFVEVEDWGDLPFN